MRPSLGFRIRSSQAEESGSGSGHWTSGQCQARWNDLAGRELQLLVGRFFRVTVTCAARRRFIYVFRAQPWTIRQQAIDAMTLRNFPKEHTDGDEMKAALGAAVALATFSAGGLPAAAQQCTGPFAACANEVSATCPVDRRGEPRITFFDRSGNAMRFEKCVGRIFAAAGQPDPYKTGQMPSGDLQMPAVEILEPSIGHRD